MLLILAEAVTPMRRGDALLAVGATLVLLGFVLRGFHQSELRAAALQAETARLARLSGKPDDTIDAGRKTGFFARRLPLLHRVAIGAGLLMAALSYGLR